MSYSNLTACLIGTVLPAGVSAHVCDHDGLDVLSVAIHHAAPAVVPALIVALAIALRRRRRPVTDCA